MYHGREFFSFHLMKEVILRRVTRHAYRIRQRSRSKGPSINDVCNSLWIWLLPPQKPYEF